MERYFTPAYSSNLVLSDLKFSAFYLTIIEETPLIKKMLFKLCLITSLTQNQQIYSGVESKNCASVGRVVDNGGEGIHY